MEADGVTERDVHLHSIRKCAVTCQEPLEPTVGKGKEGDGSSSDYGPVSDNFFATKFHSDMFLLKCC